MKALDRFFQTVDGLVERLIQKIVFALLVALVIVITIQIVFRVFFTAFSWTEEVSRFLLIYLSMLGSALAYLKGSHISVRLFQDKLTGVARVLMEILVDLFSLGFFVLLLQYSIVLITRQRYQVSGALQVPMQYIYIAIPVSMAAMILFCLGRIIHNLAGMSERKDAK